jgi:hypothetical protein
MEMVMRIDEARQQPLAVQIDDVIARAHGRTDGNDLRTTDTQYA